MIIFLGAYVRDRLPLAVFGPAIGALTLAAVWSANAVAPSAFAAAAGLTTAMVLQFRLWDDLEDRDRDAGVHPRRVVVRAAAGHVRGALLAITLLTLVSAWLVGGVPALGSLLALDLAFLAIYRVFRPLVRDGLWRFAMLPTKYPAFVAIVASSVGAPVTARVAVVLTAAYFAACGHEFWHTRPAPTVGGTL